ncbi:ATP-binding cassette domain-containing protein [Brachybacterium sp. MASK1Z-5]|uniref:ATP-binding cassette domain-containing protein n=1 Tax=Brachybacterium halotolerans TaxID=2795215 RepID=A0ABS1B923_9MICO|nr:ATP-binding cassette domain-containing protein [Brachybacterium halotolerans]MBK0331153.1 ATP-binding cassette domain-containing protein [Brachybacterium halotolerans]
MSPSTARTGAPTLRGDLAARLGLLRFIVSASPVRAVGLVVLALASMAASGGTILGLGDVVGGLAAAVQRSTADGRLVRGVLVLGASLIATPVIGSLSDVLTAGLDARVREQRSLHLARILLSPEGVAHLDGTSASGRAADLLEKIRDWRMLSSTANAQAVVTARLTGLAPLAILASWNPLVALVLLVVARLVSRVWVQYLASLLDTISGSALSTAQRRTRYAFQVASGERTAREVRLFGLLPWLRPRLAGHDRGEALFTADVPRTRSADAVALCSALVLVGVSLLLVHDALAGHLDAGRLAAVFAAAAAVLDSFGPIGDPQTLFLQAGHTHREIDALERELAPDTDQESRRGTDSGRGRSPGRRPDAAVEPHSAAVRLRDVTFHYPQHERPVLEHLDLTIPAGQTLGVVGANGAGKSTLMSLIAGLERPTSGDVEVGGLPAAPAPEQRPRVAMILQDFTRFPLSVADNVMLGRPAGPDDVDELIRRAGGAAVLERLSRENAGLETPLAPGLAGGTDLSGGQWQRLALARALAAVEDGARALVLDEPTSALDVRAEAALFEDLMELGRGVTTLLVSHRLSSVRRAERIVVLEGGRIVEDGPHEELMARGGRYAEMFTLQARRFARAGADGADSADGAQKGAEDA